MSATEQKSNSVPAGLEGKYLDLYEAMQVSVKAYAHLHQNTKEPSSTISRMFDTEGFCMLVPAAFMVDMIPKLPSREYPVVDVNTGIVNLENLSSFHQQALAFYDQIELNIHNFILEPTQEDASFRLNPKFLAVIERFIRNDLGVSADDASAFLESPSNCMKMRNAFATSVVMNGMTLLFQERPDCLDFIFYVQKLYGCVDYGCQNGLLMRKFNGNDPESILDTILMSTGLTNAQEPILERKRFLQDLNNSIAFQFKSPQSIKFSVELHHVLKFYGYLCSIRESDSLHREVSCVKEVIEFFLNGLDSRNAEAIAYSGRLSGKNTQEIIFGLISELTTQEEVINSLRTLFGKDKDQMQAYKAQVKNFGAPSCPDVVEKPLSPDGWTIVGGPILVKEPQKSIHPIAKGIYYTLGFATAAAAVCAGGYLAVFGLGALAFAGTVAVVAASAVVIGAVVALAAAKMVDWLLKGLGGTTLKAPSGKLLKPVAVKPIPVAVDEVKVDSLEGELKVADPDKGPGESKLTENPDPSPSSPMAALPERPVTPDLTSSPMAALPERPVTPDLTSSPMPVLPERSVTPDSTSSQECKTPRPDQGFPKFVTPSTGATDITYASSVSITPSSAASHAQQGRIPASPQGGPPAQNALPFAGKGAALTHRIAEQSEDEVMGHSVEPI